MSSGYIKAHVFTAAQALPISGAAVTFKSTDGSIIAKRTTNLNGQTALVEVDTPDKDLSTSPQEAGTRVYTSINIKVANAGYTPMEFSDVQVFADEVSIQNVFLIPLPEFDTPNNQPTQFTVVPQTL